MRLFCLPFAGGNVYSYRDWERYFAAHVELVPVELPGRGRRAAEPLLTSMAALSADLLAQVEPLLDEPYAIYGHSFGACLGYLLTRRALAAGWPPPVHLFCSGRNGPRVPKAHDNRHLLPRPQFVEMLREMGGTPAAILDDPGLMDFFEPVIRADFCADASYIHQLEPPLDIPLTVLFGQEAAETTVDGVRQWQHESSRPMTLRAFPGGHFFIYEHTSELGRLISAGLTGSSCAV